MLLTLSLCVSAFASQAAKAAAIDTALVGIELCIQANIGLLYLQTAEQSITLSSWYESPLSKAADCGAKAKPVGKNRTKPVKHINFRARWDTESTAPSEDIKSSHEDASQCEALHGAAGSKEDVERGLKRLLPRQMSFNPHGNYFRPFLRWKNWLREVLNTGERRTEISKCTKTRSLIRYQHSWTTTETNAEEIIHTSSTAKTWIGLVGFWS